MSDEIEAVKPVMKCPECGREEFDIEFTVRLRAKCVDGRVNVAIPESVEDLVRMMEPEDAVCDDSAGGCGTVFDALTGAVMGYEHSGKARPECDNYPEGCEECDDYECAFEGATAEQIRAEDEAEARACEAAEMSLAAKAEDKDKDKDKAETDGEAEDEAGDGLQTRADAAWRNLLQPDGAEDGGEQKQ